MQLNHSQSLSKEVDPKKRTIMQIINVVSYVGAMAFNAAFGGEKSEAMKYELRI